MEPVGKFHFKTLHCLFFSFISTKFSTFSMFVQIFFENIREQVQHSTFLIQIFCKHINIFFSSFHSFFGNFFPGSYFCFFDPKNGLLNPKNLGKESKQHRNQAKFDLICFQRFGNRFDGAEGATHNLTVCTALNPHSTLLNMEPVPQVLKQVVNLSCLFCNTINLCYK